MSAAPKGAPKTAPKGAPKPAGSNPYELKPNGPKKTVKGRVWTPEEQREKLEDYILIPKKEWEKIKYGTHMRYYTKEGEFRTGGFVASNPFQFKPKGEAGEKVAFKLQNDYNTKAPGHVSWMATYESIDRVYVKMDAAALALRDRLDNILRDTVKSINDNMRAIAARTAELGARIESVEVRLDSLEGRRTHRR